MDWAEAWKNAREKASRGIRQDIVAFWDKKADWFAGNTKGDDTEAKLLASTVKITNEMTILDIGAGTGRFSIPLAKKVKKVTAIEPSSRMADHLGETARREGVSNISVINKKWEDIDVDGGGIEPHDIVIAAYSLDVDDMKNALIKINKISREHVFVFTWYRRTFWDFKTLWPMIHGEPFIPRPDYIYILNILHDLDPPILANVKMLHREKDKVFQNMPELLHDLKGYLQVDEDSKDDMLVKYLTSVTREKDGVFYHHGHSIRAMIWWSKHPPSI